MRYNRRGRPRSFSYTSSHDSVCKRNWKSTSMNTHNNYTCMTCACFNIVKCSFILFQLHVQARHDMNKQSCRCPPACFCIWQPFPLSLLGHLMICSLQFHLENGTNADLDSSDTQTARLDTRQGQDIMVAVETNVPSIVLMKQHLPGNGT